MSQMSGIVDAALDRGPAWSAVVDAVTALLDGDDDSARGHLASGAGAVGWTQILDRLTVAGRGLLAATLIEDAGTDLGDAHEEAVTEDPGAGPVTDGSERGRVIDIRAEVIPAWSASSDAAEADMAWASLVAVSLLIADAGFPAEVVI